MLVLTRKSGESIMIGQESEIKILSVDKGTVKIGIEAPREVSVYRMELFQAIKAENIRAAASISSLETLSELLKNRDK